MAPPKKPSEISEVEEVDPHLVEVDDYDPGTDADRGEELTMVESLHRHHVLQGAETIDSIVDLGVEILDPDAETHIVRVHTDVGPVYYGGTERPVELKKNRRYRVPTSIYRYLRERGLLVDQLADNMT
jgi:hypothetical protein